MPDLIFGFFIFFSGDQLGPLRLSKTSFSSSLNPSKIYFKLQDLSSRLKKIDHIELFPISDNELTDALKFICKSRSINLSDREINYLITYSKRSISDLLFIIDKLDKYSMESKRKITIPLIKEIIGGDK